MSNFQEFAIRSTERAVPQPVFHPERRKRVRTTVHWPLIIFRNDSAEGIESTTLNLSSTGFFCLSRQSFDPGESLFCTLHVPSHDPEGKERLWILECRVRVKRTEPAGSDGLYGLACEMEDYRLLSSHRRSDAEKGLMPFALAQ